MPSSHPTSAAKHEALLATAIQTLQSELAQDHFSAAIGKFREAINLSRSYSQLEDQVLSLASDLARQTLPGNWPIARCFLNEAAGLKPTHTFPPDLLKEIQKHEQDQAIQIKVRFAAPRQQQPATLAETRPADRPLPAEPTRQPVEPVTSPAIVPWSKTSTVDHLKSAATLLFATAALAAAIALIWLYHPGQTKHPVNPDAQAWSTVNPNDLDLVESYLTRFPNGANRDQAIQALARIRVSHRESAEILNAVSQYASQKGIQVSTTSQPRIEGNQATVQCFANQTPVTFELARQNGSWNIESMNH